VVLIRLADGAETEDDSTKQPSPTTRLQAGDRLRVMGTAQALGQLDQ
jgi:K+/H+ antiporter YhaU regulatory subunit KhtT